MSQTPGLLDADIFPGLGIGNVRLDMPRKEVQAILGKPSGETQVEGDFGNMEYPGITICFANGKSHMIVADEGFRGRAPTGVYIGMKWSDFQKTRPSAAFDVEKSLWSDGEVSGIWYDIARPPRQGEEPIRPPWIAEAYEVQDPEKAFVRAIYVMAT